jgi:hypothetical protein
VSSTHDPILLLEPSNLLEPLSLEDRNLDPFNRVARFGGDGTSLSGTARTRSRPISVLRGRRWPLKSALIVAGGLACFGAGTALPSLSMFGQHSPTVESATRLPPAAAPVKPEATKPAEPKLTEPKLTEPKLTESKLTESTPPAPSQAAARDANAANNAPPSAAPAPAQPAPDRSAPATDAVGGATPAANVQPADTRRADPRVDGRQQDAERAQPSPRNRRAAAAQRDTIAQPFAVDENIPGANPGESRPNRDANRGSSRRRDRTTADNARATNDWSLWRDQETDRPSSRRRDRYDDDARGDDRRGTGRASRYGGRSLFPFFDEW